MEQVVRFMEELLEDMDGTYWQIESVEEFEEVTESDTEYAKMPDGSTYEKQDNIYVYQTSGHLGDNYSGTIIKPITEKLALRIVYSC